jgi:hypothetical protein
MAVTVLRKLNISEEHMISICRFKARNQQKQMRSIAELGLLFSPKDGGSLFL